jgi:ribonuclease Z
MFITVEFEDMFEICFLGTMSSVPSAERALNSTLILHEGSKYLVDCGEGVQQRILQSGVGFSGLTDVFISHGHIDHFVGLAGLLLALDTFDQRTKLRIHADSQTLVSLQKLISLCDLHGHFAFDLVETHEGIILEDKKIVVRAFPLRHTVACHGLLFEELEKRAFSVKLAQASGIPKNLWGRLQKGETVTFDGNKTISPDDVLEPPMRGCSLAYIADTEYFDGLVGFCQNASCIICEATYLDADKNLAAKHRHLTAKQAGLMAREAKAKSLIANHLSHRYKASEVAQELERFFPGAVVPNDLDVLKVVSMGIEAGSRKN